MERLISNREIQIIKEARSILKENMFLKAIYLNNSFFPKKKELKGNEKFYKNIDYKLRAIRQDFRKIFTIMSLISERYKESIKESIKEKSKLFFQDDIGCLIEYLFIKYRVILEYIHKILKEVLFLDFSDKEIKEYHKKEYEHVKFQYLLDYFIEKNKDNSNLDIKIFKEITDDRNSLVHNGATCVVCYDFREEDDKYLKFKINSLDELNKEKEIKKDIFYQTEKGLIIYDFYWGLYISKLIVFLDNIYRFILDKGILDNSSKEKIDDLLKNKIVSPGEYNIQKFLNDIILRLGKD
jgi:hypothetical protein